MTPESTAWLIQTVYSVGTALGVFLLGWYISRLVSHNLRRLIQHSGRFDPTIGHVFYELTRYAILIVTFVLVLGQFGVQTTSILAVLGAVGLAVALALQGTLSNMAAGIMLLWLRPFNIGEYIDGEGIAGSVLEIGLFATKLRTFEGIYIFAPNSRLWDAKITNYGREPKRLIKTKVGIAYSASIAEARAVMLKLAEDKRILPDPAPYVFVASLGASSVDLEMRSWVKTSDFWETQNSLLERTKLAFDAAGIEIPYSKLDVNILSQPASERADSRPAEDTSNKTG